MLAYGVEEGTGVNAQIPGYQVAGKTGTARKLDESGRYVQRYYASFVGLPARGRPAGRDRRRRSTNLVRSTAALAAAPLFQEIARYAIQRLAIPAAPPVALPPHAQGSP